MATTSLLELRSAVADDLVTYLAALGTRLEGRRLRRPLDAILITPDLHQPEPAHPIDELVASLHTAIIFGEPEGGRTSWLRQFVGKRTNGARAALVASKALPEDVCVPVLLRVSDLSNALMPDKERALEEILIGIGVGSPNVEISQPGRRVGAALLLALYGSFSAAFPARARRLLWSKLWTGEGEPDPAAPLIALDGWDELPPSDQSRVAPYLQDFVDQTAARVFIGSRFAVDRVQFLRIDYERASQSALVLSPYELPVPTLLPGFSVWRPARDLGELAQITSSPRFDPKPPVGIRRSKLRAISAFAGVILGASVIWQLLLPAGQQNHPPPGLQIINPRDGDDVCYRTPIDVGGADAAAKVWAIVHPMPDIWYYVQPSSDSEPAYFGQSPTSEIGIEFQIMAVVDPSAELYVGQKLGIWPKARVKSPIAKVTRKAC
jgi:hypothetical protein